MLLQSRPFLLQAMHLPVQFYIIGNQMEDSAFVFYVFSNTVALCMQMMPWPSLWHYNPRRWK